MSSELRTSEILLNTLAGESARSRVQVVLVQEEGAASRIELRQQSFGEGVGWFTQGTVALEPGQVAGLRGVLGTTGARQSQLPVAYRQAPRVAAESQLRVCRADSA